MFLIGGDDALDERMTDDVALGKFDEGDAFDGTQRLLRFDKAGFLVRRQIDLRDVASDTALLL